MVLEECGVIGEVSVKPDAKDNGGNPSLHVSMMPTGELGKGAKFLEAKVTTVNDTVHGFQPGQKAALRFEGVQMVMNQFGKWNVRADTVRIINPASIKNDKAPA
jgi:hypothetical protein